MSRADTPRAHANWRRRLLILGGVAVFAVICSWGLFRYVFPYGWSHACSKGLAIDLRMYASEHKGWLPYGGTTPEGSLGLLANYDYDAAIIEVLAGKNIPRKVVQNALKQRGELGPESCGWHYVEGLRQGDEPDIMVAWDKVVGLWHNGDRRPGLMHEIVRLESGSRFITKEEWPQFVAEQKELLTKVIASRQTNDPPIRWSDEATLGPNRFPPPTVSRVLTNAATR